MKPQSGLPPAHDDLPPLAETAPPLHRGSMPPRPWLGFGRGLCHALLSLLLGRRSPDAAEPAPRRQAAQRRRLALALLVLGSTAAAVGIGHRLTPDDAPLDTLQWTLFGVLFAWVAAGFYSALMGFVVLWRGDPMALSAAGLQRKPLSPGARTAILMPICNEDVSTVFAGLRATCESLAATGMIGLFDVYVLSDTKDPAVRAAEVQAWRELRALMGDGDAEGRPQHLFYRWRQRRTKRKSGNVADFCRRWGRDYRYMVVMDADSVMSGDCLVSLVRLMEANPRAGILQTAPRACGHDTLHARAQAFVGRVTGRLFSAGLAYWQLGESHYWGHNAILRVEPFMRHCGLAPLKGRGGLAGEIMSHDFVEAALMRRAGYEVWLVPDLDGSFEQQPPNLIDELQRDRRWCQGNLQNARLIAEPGFRAVHRTMFITGALSYAASPLWLGFVLIGLWQGLHPGTAVPLPAWPIASSLWIATATMLLLPRLLGVGLVIARGEQAAFGGKRGLVAGALLEAVLSALQAPVRMVAHSLFVLIALTGLKLDWKSPSRDATAVRWRDALASFGKPVLLVAAGVAALLAVDPNTALRVAPVALPLLLAIPLAVWTSQVAVGAALRRRRLLLIPEEAAPAPALQRAWDYAARWLPANPTPAAAVAVPAPARRSGGSPLRRGLVAAVVAIAPATTMMGPPTALVADLSYTDEVWRSVQLERLATMRAEAFPTTLSAKDRRATGAQQKPRMMATSLDGRRAVKATDPGPAAAVAVRGTKI